jgi:hypothetical protein
MFNLLRQLSAPGFHLTTVSGTELRFRAPTQTFAMRSEFLGDLSQPLDYGLSEQDISDSDRVSLDFGSRYGLENDYVGASDQ